MRDQHRLMSIFGSDGPFMHLHSIYGNVTAAGKFHLSNLLTWTHPSQNEMWIKHRTHIAHI